MLAALLTPSLLAAIALVYGRPRPRPDEFEIFIGPAVDDRGARPMNPDVAGGARLHPRG